MRPLTKSRQESSTDRVTNFSYPFQQKDCEVEKEECMEKERDKRDDEEENKKCGKVEKEECKEKERDKRDDEEGNKKCGKVEMEECKEKERDKRHDKEGE